MTYNEVVSINGRTNIPIIPIIINIVPTLFNSGLRYFVNI